MYLLKLTSQHLMTFFVPRSNIIKPLMRTIGKGALRWTIISGVSGRSHLFVKWKDLAIMCSCAFSESGNAFVFSSKMTKGLSELCLQFCKAKSSQSRTTGRARQEGTAKQSVQTKLWFWKCDWCIFPFFKTLGILRSVRKYDDGCGCGCFRIQCCLYFACQDLLGRRSWPFI